LKNHAVCFLSLCLSLSAGALAQRTLWVKQIAGKDAHVRSIGLVELDQDHKLWVYKADQTIGLGRKKLEAGDTSNLKALVVDAAGNLRPADSIPKSIIAKIPSAEGNPWILKTQERNGNYFLAYGLSTPLRLPSNLNWSLAFLDANGHRLWEHHLPENQQVHDLEFLPGGKCLLAGSEVQADGNLNILIALWDEYGHKIWQKSLGGRGDDEAFTACHDTEGNLYIGGIFAADSSFLGNTSDLSGKEKDGFIAAFDLKGNEKFFYRQRGTGANAVQQIACSPLGQIFFVASVWGKDWRLAPFGFPKIGKTDAVLGLVDPKSGKENETALRVFPNPARELVYFGLEKPALSGPLLATLHQKDGTVMQQTKISGTPGTSFRFNVSNTPPGAYFVTLKNKKKQLTERVVIE
jgi:hypothetical protein